VETRRKHFFQTSAGRVKKSKQRENETSKKSKRSAKNNVRQHQKSFFETRFFRDNNKKAPLAIRSPHSRLFRTFPLHKRENVGITGVV
jgi:hypothetical protein